jgi:hypothetical protein
MLSFEHGPPRSYVQQLQRDVAEIFRSAHLNLHWEILAPHHQPGSYTRAVVVDVHGRCGFPRIGEVSPHHGANVRLGWTLVNDGEVFPHAVVDCDRIAAVIAGARTQAPHRQVLPDLYARLTARVVAHELLHALLRSADHTPSGDLKTPLRLGDLLGPVRLSHNTLQALRQLGRPAVPALAATR